MRVLVRPLSQGSCLAWEIQPSVLTVLALVTGLMAVVCLAAGVVALVAAASMGAGRPFRHYLVLGLLLVLPALVAGRPLFRLLGRNFVALVAGGALLVLAWSALGARWHARGTPNLLDSARRLSRLGSRLVLIGSGLALAALLVGMRV